MWLLKNSTNLLSSLGHLGVHKATSIQTFDFSTLYTSIPHDLLKSRMTNIINNAFKHKNGATRYTHIKVGRNKSHFTSDPLNGDNKYTANDICKMIEFLVDNIYVRFGGQLFRQMVGIPMGTNCAPKFVARLLRKKLSGNLNSTSKVTTIDHNAEITKNFWKYVKSYVEGEKSDNQEPPFGKKKCVDYFKAAVKSLSPKRLFVIPSWIPRFKEPEHSFDTSISAYAEITRIIGKIKSKGSPCPLDQISIILFERSPSIRTIIHH